MQFCDFFILKRGRHLFFFVKNSSIVSYIYYFYIFFLSHLYVNLKALHRAVLCAHTFARADNNPSKRKRMIIEIIS